MNPENSTFKDTDNVLCDEFGEHYTSNHKPDSAPNDPISKSSSCITKLLSKLQIPYWLYLTISLFLGFYILTHNTTNKTWQETHFNQISQKLVDQNLYYLFENKPPKHKDKFVEDGPLEIDNTTQTQDILDSIDQFNKDLLAQGKNHQDKEYIINDSDLPYRNEQSKNYTLDSKYTIIPIGLNSTIEVNFKKNFLIPHTHTDLGWLYPVDEYYRKYVKFILDSVVQELSIDPRRKFSFSDIGYFKKWWDELTDDVTKKKTKRLIQSGRLDLVNGAISQNDNACVSYEDTIENYFYGHQFIFKNFGVFPTVGWHIDSFGLSASMPILLQKMGFHGYVINRIDYQDKINRTKNKDLDFLWNPTDKTNLLTHIQPNHYSAPQPIYLFAMSDPPFVTGDTSFNPFSRLCCLNIISKANSLLDNFKINQDLSKSIINFYTYGEDFTFRNAGLSFEYAEYTMSLWNSNPLRFDNSTISYTTATKYFELLKKETNINYQNKYSDFFPYRDTLTAYWVGYYTTRPNFKRQVKIFGQIFRACKQIFTKLILEFEQLTILKSQKNKILSFFDEYGQQLGIMNHHDAISGTHTEITSVDYLKRIDKINQSTNFFFGNLISEFFEFLTNESSGVKVNLISEFSESLENEQSGDKVKQAPIEVDPKQKYKVVPIPDDTEKYSKMDLVKKESYINIQCNIQPGEICHQEKLMDGQAYSMKVYNPKQSGKELLRLEVLDKNIKILDELNKEIQNDVQCEMVAEFDSNGNESMQEKCVLYFVAFLPSHNFTFYKIMKLDTDGISENIPNQNRNLDINECTKINMSSTLKFGIGCSLNKKLISIYLNDLSFNFDISYKYYDGDDRSSTGYAHSGHYLFVPNETCRFAPLEYNTLEKAIFKEGKFVKELAQVFTKTEIGLFSGVANNQVITKIRFIEGYHTADYKDSLNFDLETFVKKFLEEENINKDVVVNYETSLLEGYNDNSTVFWTDSNGLIMLQRNFGKLENFGPELDRLESSFKKLPKWASANYYPVTSCIFTQSCLEKNCKSEQEINFETYKKFDFGEISFNREKLGVDYAEQVGKKHKKKRMSVVVDRSQGGTSRYPGMIEIMLNRISGASDKKGISEIYKNYEDVTFSHKVLFEFDGKFFRL